MSINSSNSGMDVVSMSSGASSLPHWNIGLPSELSELNLPNNSDVLKYYLFLSELEKKKNKKQHSYGIFTQKVSNKLIEIWNKLNIELIHPKSVVKKLNNLINTYKKELKCKSKANTTSEFLHTLNDVFYLGKCQCVKTMACCCGLIPPHLQEFMVDQHSTRKHTIPECCLNTEDQQSTQPPSSFDPTYNPGSSQMDDNSETEFAVPREPPLLKKRCYTQRYDAANFAMICDRFGISDRVASCLATALFKDIGFKDENGEPIIMDKCKVAREKQKCRDSVRRKYNDNTDLVAFSFDGRKNTALTREEINGTFHPRTLKESHLVVLREPESKLLGHIKLNAEDAKTKHRQLNEFFLTKNISINNLIGICCDGEATNTGTENGILRRFEVALDRPLHWFVCLLHFNERPLHHLFCTLEKSVTYGPRTASGDLMKQLETCEQLPVCKLLLSKRFTLFSYTNNISCRLYLILKLFHWKICLHH